MNNEVTTNEHINNLYSEISGMVLDAKLDIRNRISISMTTLYWNIRKLLVNEVINGLKPEYGKNIIGEISIKLTHEYGKGFDRTSVFRMIQFHQKFPIFEKVVTLSQQLTWSHFVELLPI